MATDGFSPEPLAFARLRAGQVTFLQADAMPAGLGELAAAFAGLWSSHVPIAPRRRFLITCARLRAGAQVILIDNGALVARLYHRDRCRRQHPVTTRALP